MDHYFIVLGRSPVMWMGLATENVDNSIQCKNYSSFMWMRPITVENVFQLA